MERPQVANMNLSLTNDYQLVCSNPSYSTGRKRLDYLSRNVLVIIGDYLTFLQLLILTSSAKKIKAKLDNFYEDASEDSYFKKRAVLYFQSFFFQQFAATDLFF